MTDYKSMYFQLAAKVADAVELLTAAQLQGEDAYIEGADATIIPGSQSEFDKDKDESEP